MKKGIFKGAATAIITPMKNREVDFDALRRLVDFQIENGIDALVAAGTTGESSTLTDEEHVEVIKTVVDKAAGRVPVIAGTGSNDAAYAVKLSQDACRLGADALLLVTPYYNKATQQGLVEMYKAIAAEVDRPIILYNVPSRTGVNIWRIPPTSVPLRKQTATSARSSRRCLWWVISLTFTAATTIRSSRF